MKAKILIMKTVTTNGRIIRNSEMPADLVAVSSMCSPNAPKVIMEASNTAKGNASGTKRAEA